MDWVGSRSIAIQEHNTSIRQEGVSLLGCPINLHWSVLHSVLGCGRGMWMTLVAQLSRKQQRSSIDTLSAPTNPSSLQQSWRMTVFYCSTPAYDARRKTVSASMFTESQHTQIATSILNHTIHDTYNKGWSGAFLKELKRSVWMTRSWVKRGRNWTGCWMLTSIYPKHFICSRTTPP